VTRVGHQHPRRQRLQQVVVVAITAACLIADLEAIGQSLQHLEHLVDASDLRALDNLPILVEDANRNARAVNVETDVEHGSLPFKCLGTHLPVPR
jgi:hypothetical protein